MKAAALAAAKTRSCRTSDSKAKRPVICTVMRVKNEEMYLAAALRSLKPLGGPVVVLDDGSTDHTGDIARRLRFVHYHRQDDLPMDEGRDRTRLYRWALELEPDWIFTLDGDEVLHESTPEKMKRAAKRCADDVNVFSMYLAVMASPLRAQKEMWVSGPKRLWSMGRLFRVAAADPKHEFTSDYENNLHCGCVPVMEREHKEQLNAWIKYYGYESPEAVEKKRVFYSKHDPAHFPQQARMWASRVKQGKAGFPANPCCQELGITGTVQY